MNDGGAVFVQTGGGLSRFGTRESLGPAMSEVRLIGNGGALLNPVPSAYLYSYFNLATPSLHHRNCPQAFLNYFSDLTLIAVPAFYISVPANWLPYEAEYNDDKLALHRRTMGDPTEGVESSYMLVTSGSIK